MTRDELLAALLVEQYAHPTREFHNLRPETVDVPVDSVDDCAQRRRTLHAELVAFELGNPGWDPKTHGQRRMRVVA